MKTSYLYRRSNIPVIEQIPSDWKEIRGKYLLQEREERSSDGNEDLLSVSQYTGVTRKRKHTTGSNDSRASSLVGYKRVDIDNLAINIMLAWNGSLGVSKYQGIVSPAYGVYKISHEVFPTYLHYLAKTEEYKTLFKMYSTGVIDSRLRLYTDQLFSLRFIVPSYIEQEQIARYLDYKNHLINKYIRIKKKQIELLKELKQTIINDAVTGKIDVRTGKPYPKYKDSCVDWLGMIPDEWSVLALGHCAKKVKTGGTPRNVSESHYEECGIPWYTPGDFSDDLYLGDSARRLTQKAAEEIVRFPEGSVMMIGIGATIGKTCVTKQSASCNQQINAILVNRSIQPEYLALLLRCCRDFIVATGNYTTLPIINQESTKRLMIIVPELSIQIRITEFVSMRLYSIDDQIGCLISNIASIRELQTRLISDVVTGKLDVRSIEIPDFKEESEFLDDVIDESSVEENEYVRD